MVGSTYVRFILTSSLAFAACTVMASSASAQLIEPPDTVNTSGFGPIPKDPRTFCSSAKVGGSIGCTGTADTGDYQQYSGNTSTLDNNSLIGLFKYYESDGNGNLLMDFAKDAKTEPATFNPLCNITGKMVLHGGGCLVDFGWYCADPSADSTTQPVIHPLVTVDDILNFAKNNPSRETNSDGTFLPKVSYYIKGSTGLGDLANDTNFRACKSKMIGFAVAGNSTKNCGISTGACACPQNKYSERQLNQISTASGQPYIAAVMYESKKTPGLFYVAVEDLPTSPERFDASWTHKDVSSGKDLVWNADGDFNDFVYTVEGVVCQGGGQLCTVPNQQGICATGVTSCVTDANQTPSCDPVFTPQKETCNAIDDDCNGQIDDGDNLCPAGKTCYKGTCVGSCASGEIVCPAEQVCVGAGNGFCIDASCATLNCAADQKCVAGQCVGGCTGVTCNAGEQCVAGKCVDLCDARQQAGLPACPENFVCQNGACVPNCTCLNCPDLNTQECQTNPNQPGFGRCVASGCADGHCGNQLCLPGGICVADPCASNTCETGQTCTAAKQYDSTQALDHQYSCTNPDGSSNGGASGTGGAGQCLQNCGAQAGSGNGNSGNPSVPGAVNNGTSTTKGVACGCRVPTKRGASAWGLAGLAGLALLGLRRRRRNE